MESRDAENDGPCVVQSLFFAASSQSRSYVLRLQSHVSSTTCHCVTALCIRAMQGFTYKALILLSDRWFPWVFLVTTSTRRELARQTSRMQVSVRNMCYILVQSPIRTALFALARFLFLTVWIQTIPKNASVCLSVCLFRHTARVSHHGAR